MTERTKPWARPLAIATAATFAVSSGFPVAAGLARDTSRFPRWVGPVDVGIAFILSLLAFTVVAFAQGQTTREAIESTYRAYRVLIHVVFLLLVIFFVAGDRINWVNCLTGFAWRGWLLMYALPFWFTLMQSK